MPKETPDYISIEGALYKRAPEPAQVHTALEARSLFTPLQDGVASLNRQLAGLIQIVPAAQQAVVKQQVAPLAGALTNVVKGLMGDQPNFNKAKADLEALKPKLQETATAVLQQLGPATIDNLIQLLNSFSAAFSAEQAGMGIPGVQVQQPAAPAAPAAAPTIPPPAPAVAPAATLPPTAPPA